MPYANNDGVRIHYKVEGEGPTLILQHGYTMNLERWYQVGYVDALKSHYRLILIDLRGHGASDKPHDRAAYTWPVEVMDVLAVIDDLNLSQTMFWGYSRGGAIGFGLAKYAPERVQSLVIGGAGADASDLGTALAHVDGSDPEEFVAAYEARACVRFPADYREMLLACDTKAIAAAAQDRPSLNDDLPNMKMPCLLYVGEQDGVYRRTQATAKQMPQAKFISLTGLNHAGAFRSVDLVLPIVTEYLQTIIEDVAATEE